MQEGSMRNVVIVSCAFLLMAIATSCNDDNSSGTQKIDDYSIDGGWTCAVGVSCQDVYDIGLDAGTQLSIAVTSVTGNSVVRLAAFAPGVALNGINLLTGGQVDRQCVGQNICDSLVVAASASGTYRIAIGRDWGQSAGASGTYHLHLTSDLPFRTPMLTVDNLASQAASSGCPSPSFQVDSGWTCGIGVDCQDVYDLVFTAATSGTITVTNVTGNSVIRLALFGPGGALNGTN